MNRTLVLVGAGEALVGIVAWLGLWMFDTHPSFVSDKTTLAVAAALTILLAVVNLGLLSSLNRYAPRFRALQPVRALLEEELFPMLRHVRPVEILVLSGLAAVGEELFFRGLLQPHVGIVFTSLLFGLVHGPHRSLWPLALWATIMGWILGLMYAYSNSLTLPILVHFGYDALALSYVRYGDSGKRPGADAPQKI